MMKTFLAVVLGACILGIGAAALFIESGAYNIGATTPHWGITRSLIEKMRDRSIAAHSSDLRLPPAEYRAYAGAGLSHFEGMCRFCHGAPGRAPYEFADGLFPSAPPLMAPHVQKRPDGELYWIIANGIKMTGMPAFGPTHKEEDLLGILAVVRLLPDLGPQEYAQMLKTAGPHGEEGGKGPHHQPSKGREGHEGSAPAHRHEGGQR